MKRTFLFFMVLAIFVCSCKETKEESNSENELSGEVIKNPGTLSGSANEKFPELTFETHEHDFGKIIEGEKKSYDFIFTNTGEAPLIISDVKASCGCTVPDWPRHVIKAGESDVIHVVYDSKGYPGEFSKGIVVTANTYPNTTTLKISGTVFKK